MVKVTVCIPTYNRSHFLPEAIASVLEQEFTDFELIVCDDGSQDETPQLMANFTEPRLHYLRHECHLGKSNNMITGFRAARGAYFIKFDDDDRLTPDFLRKTVAILDHHPEIDFVSTDHWLINEYGQRELALTEQNSQRWGRTTLPPGPILDLLTRTFVQQSLQMGATLFRRTTLEAVDYLRPHLKNCEDNDLLVRLAIAGKRAYYLPEKLMEYRFHPEQQGLKRAIIYLQDKLEYLNRHTFTDSELEAIRQRRIHETQLLLGLRLIESGETQAGQILLQQGKTHSALKASIGQLIAILPAAMRPLVFAGLRQLKSTSLFFR